MADGPVVVQRHPDTLGNEFSGGNNVYQEIIIKGKARAQLGNHHVTHNNYYDDRAQSRVLDELSKLHYSEVHERIQRLRLPDTGSWLLESDKYLQWRDDTVSDSRRTHSLWCHGPPGVGKTFLASNIIDDLHARIEGSQYAYVYLYANRDRGFEQDVSSYLSCLARRLVEMIPASERVANLQVVEAHNRAKDRRTPPTLLMLLKALSMRFERVYVVLDALDEFSGDPDDRLRLVEAFLSFQLAAEPGAIRICITSRQSEACQSLLRPQWSAKIESSPQDLDVYIETRIGDSTRLASLCRRGGIESFRRGRSDIESRIFKEVHRTSGGVFKVVSLQMDVIARQISGTGILKALKNFPSHMDAYYQQSLGRIQQNDDFGPVIRRMLGWLLCLHEPLTHEELAQAMGVSSDTPSDSRPDDLEVYLPTLIDLAEGFLVSYPSKRLPVTFTHETVRSFLHSKLVLEGASDWNADIARTYLRYMRLPWCVRALNSTCERQLQPWGPTPSPTAWFSLVLKAAASWYTYACAAREDVSSSEHDFAATLRKGHGSPLILSCLHSWPSIVQILINSNMPIPCDPDLRPLSPIHVAVRLGREDVVRALSNNTALDINATGLCADENEDQDETWPYLTGSGARTWTLKWTHSRSDRNVYLNVLQRWKTQCVFCRRVASKEHDEYYEIPRRVEQEPPFTAQFIANAFGNPPLHLALGDCTRSSRTLSPRRSDSPCQNSEMLKILLERKEINVNAPGFAGFTPLMVAIQNTNVHAVQTLLNHKDIDVNLVTRSDHALSFTIHRICFQRYKLLRERLNTSDTVDETESPVFARLLRILQVLLQQPGMEVDQPDALGHTALDWLEFYRSLTANKDLRAFIASEREWVGSTGRDIASSILHFHERAQIPFSAIARVLEECSAKSAKTVALDDWLEWFCPLPQRVYEEVSDFSDDELEQRAEDVEGLEEDIVDEVFFLRVPFSDGYLEPQGSEEHVFPAVES